MRTSDLSTRISKGRNIILGSDKSVRFSVWWLFSSSAVWKCACRETSQAFTVKTNFVTSCFGFESTLLPQHRALHWKTADALVMHFSFPNGYYMHSLANLALISSRAWSPFSFYGYTELYNPNKEKYSL